MMIKKILFSTALSAGLFGHLHAASISFDAGADSAQSVSLQFPGEVFDRSNTLAQISKRADKSGVTAGERFLLSYIESNKGTNKDAILGLWDPRERDEVGQMMSDPEALRANSAFFSNIVSSNLMATMQYRDHELFYVSHKLKGTNTRISQVYAARKASDGKLYATNGLADDFYYSRLSDVMAEYLAKEVLKLN